MAVAAAAFTALSYVTGHAVLASYLLLVRFPPTGELTIFCGALVGASLGFLWYNSYPADVFMGDVGSLGLGGALGTVAILIKQELLLPIVGGVWVLEALSVIIQVGYFKATRQARLQDGAAAPPLRATRLERAEGHHPLPHPGDHLRVVQPDNARSCGDAVAAHDFSVTGQRVVVVGAARSGIAAAELLASRGARVLLTETRTAFAEASRLREAGIELELGGHAAATLAAADLIVISPGVPLDQPVFDAGAAARRRDDRRARARVAMAARPGHRHHRDQGEVDDDDADRPDAVGRRSPRRWSAATSACR